jgi:hypothetical protein
MDHRLYVKIWCHTNEFLTIDAATFNLDLVKGRELTGSGENCLQWTEKAVSGFVKKRIIYSKTGSGCCIFRTGCIKTGHGFSTARSIFFKKMCSPFNYHIISYKNRSGLFNFKNWFYQK